MDIPRSATRRSAETGIESRPLSGWSNLDAFVLLAEPGGGKSCALKFESGVSGGVYVKARTFATLGPPPGWLEETLFIDGLDEMRADSASRNGPLDDVIQRLDGAGRPRFRLSCREADWLASVDQEALRAVAPGQQIEVLYLDPLNDSEVTELLSRRSDRVPDPQRFRQQAEDRGLDDLLRNPLLLELLVDAVGADWPRGRADVFRLACERMAAEHNPAIREARSGVTAPLDQLLDDAGLLSAVLLLSGLDALNFGAAVDPNADVSVQALPSALGIVDVRAALASKLFAADGERRLPRHRSVAEYLAARAVGRRVSHAGLPMARVLSLMCGRDGGIVEPLRGLTAWLAVACPQQRPLLIDRDPLACVLYGDVHAFDPGDKRKVLEGLRREAERFVWFRRGSWAAHPFGALGTANMAPQFEVLLASDDRSQAHQSLLDCVLDAIRHGDAMPRLLKSLESIVRDASYRDDVRSGALKAWLAQAGEDLSRAWVLLDDIQAGAIADHRNELIGSLLDALYPKVLGPAEVMRYFRLSSENGYFGTYRNFWSAHLIDRTPISARPLLIDALVSAGLAKTALHAYHELPGLVGNWIAVALDAIGPNIEVSRLSDWLALGLDEYGSAALKGADGQGIRDRLERHPDMQRAVVAYEYVRLQPDPQSGRFHFWQCEERLYGLRRSGDWYRWFLSLAGTSASQELAKYCFLSAASRALDPTPDCDLGMEEVEHWVAKHRHRWPLADQWLEHAWSSSLDDYRREQHQRDRVRRAEHVVKRERRRAEYRKHLARIESGQAWPSIMEAVALAYRGHFSDFRGETPEARVCDLLVVGPKKAALAISGLAATLSRVDLPNVADILRAELDQKPHYLRAACLLGAELAHARDLEAPSKWSEELVRRLVAFRLTAGTGDVPSWYDQLAANRPAVVAEVLVAYARQCLDRRADHAITGLWPLARDDVHAELARIVVPPLLSGFPLRARPSQIRRLNSELLPAAVRHLPIEKFKVIVNDRLAMECLDSGQRMAWLIAGLRFAPHRRSGLIRHLVGASRVRALRLGSMLEAQTKASNSGPKLPISTLGRLVEMLAPRTSPEYSLGAGIVGPRERLRDLVRGLVSQIANFDDESAGLEIARLRALPALGAWKVVLDSALFDHVRLLRSAGYKHASAGSVANLLAALAPANALDLAALIVQQLQGLQADLHGDDTNSLRRFWRDPTDKGEQPRIENECRDRLLDKLRGKLELQSVSLHKEAAHANDTRADLRAETFVSSHRKIVPIEVKKEDHPEVWTAWRDQLEGRYMTDPAAEGVGIYLVLWFGFRPIADRQGVVPVNALEMQERLAALVPPDDRVRLQVRVLDLSIGAIRKAGKLRKPRTKRQMRRVQVSTT